MTTVGVLVMAHGTPRSLHDLAAFYTEIRRGSPPSAGQLAELESRYRAIGGTSPLNDRTAAQIAGLDAALEGVAPGRFTVAAGAKFADPRIEDAVDALATRGARHIVGVVLAPHYSAASVGEYARRAAEAAARRPEGIELSVVPHWYDAPGLAAVLAQRVRHALDRLGAAHADATVLFTAHSVPARLVDGGDPYAEQVRQSASAVAAEAGLPRWAVAYQSAGRTDDVWLGPDVRDVIAELAREGVPGVVVCPIGFVSDHLEVLYDLDVEAAEVARRSGISFSRTSSLNDDPEFCAVLAHVVMRAADQGTAAPHS